LSQAKDVDALAALDSQTVASAPTPWFDRFGTGASAACALHCAILSFAPAVLPLIGLGILHDERFEWSFLAVAVLFAVVAAGFGHRVHGSWPITGAFALGVTALVSARVFEVSGIEGGLWLALTGGAIVVGAHLFNLRRCRACHDEACTA
jgi:hypothetical protein